MWEWSSKNLFMSAEVTPEPGFYNPDRTPGQKRVLGWASDKRVNDIIMVTAAQTFGKTTVINCIVSFYAKADPASQLVVNPAVDDARDWIREKFMPMVRSSPVLAKIIPDESSRITGQTMLVKHYPGGRIQAFGANSPSKLRGRSFRIVVQDDVDGFKDNNEGDPSAQADKRANMQPRALRIKASTPTITNLSRIWKWLEQSTFEQMLCPCPKCDHEQTLEWDQVVGNDAAPEETRYKCVKCGELWDDTMRYNAVIEGMKRDHWFIRNPRSKIKGIQMNGLYRIMGEKNSTSGFLEEFWREYMAARAGGEKTMQVWKNTFLAICYQPAAETIEPSVLYKRRENYKPTEMLPEEVLVLVASVDVQGNRLECEVRGIGLGQESWGVEYRIFPGDPTEEYVWKKLDAFLAQTYNHPIRGKIRIPFCFVDAGGSKQNEAYIFTETRNHRGIYACRGAKDLNAPSLSPLKKAGYNSVPFYFVGVNSNKDTLHSRLRLSPPGAGERTPGFLHWPISDDYDETYFKSLTAEKKVVAKKGAHKGKLVWECPEGVRNEAWDINVYIISAIEAAGFTERNLRQIARDNDRLREQMNLPPKPPSKVTTGQELMQPAKEEPKIPAGPKITKDDLAAAVAGAAIAAVTPAESKPDPNAAAVTPASAPIQPATKQTPWKVWGKGSNWQPPGGFARW